MFDFLQSPRKDFLSTDTHQRLTCKGRYHKLNMNVDLQSLVGLHVTWCAQLYSLAETPQPPQSPRIWTRIRGRYWSAKTDDISLWPPGSYQTKPNSTNRSPGRPFLASQKWAPAENTSGWERCWPGSLSCPSTRWSLAGCWWAWPLCSSLPGSSSTRLPHLATRRWTALPVSLLTSFRSGSFRTCLRCCYITVDSATTALQNVACTKRCISKQMRYKTPFSHNVYMKSLEIYENYFTLFCLEK